MQCAGKTFSSAIVYISRFICNYLKELIMTEHINPEKQSNKETWSSVSPPYLTYTHRPPGKATKATETPFINPLEYKQFNLLSPKQHRPTTTTDTSQNTLTQNCQAYLNVTTKRFYETMPACGLIFAKLKPQSATAIQK